MRSEHIEDVLIHLHSGQWFGWSDPSNKTYDNLIVHGGQDKPTQEFLESELAILQSEYDAQEYARNRQAEYPSLNELTVALWEGVVEERMASIMELEVQRQAVKAKYPK